jgi:hypothetical protein
MKKEQLIHIKLDSEEAGESRRDVLNTEVDLIKIAQAIRKYRILRLKELQLKIKLYNQTKCFRTDMNHLKTILPKLEIPRLLKKHEQEMHEQEPKKLIEKIKTIEMKQQKVEKKVKQEKPHEDSLERQLREIQDKLNRL